MAKKSKAKKPAAKKAAKRKGVSAATAKTQAARVVADAIAAFAAGYAEAYIKRESTIPPGARVFMTHSAFAEFYDLLMSGTVYNLRLGKQRYSDWAQGLAERNTVLTAARIHGGLAFEEARTAGANLSNGLTFARIDSSLKVTVKNHCPTAGAGGGWVCGGRGGGG
jgi:hypothetical protein